VHFCVYAPVSAYCGGWAKERKKLQKKRKKERGSTEKPIFVSPIPIPYMGETIREKKKGGKEKNASNWLSRASPTATEGREEEEKGRSCSSYNLFFPLKGIKRKRKKRSLCCFTPSFAYLCRDKGEGTIGRKKGTDRGLSSPLSPSVSPSWTIRKGEEVLEDRRGEGGTRKEKFYNLEAVSSEPLQSAQNWVNHEGRKKKEGKTNRGGDRCCVGRLAYMFCLTKNLLLASKGREKGLRG